jgi:hypothetical protein
MEFLLGFFNDSASPQDWIIRLDGVSIAQFSLAAHTGTPKYVKVTMKEGDKVEMSVTTQGFASADLTRTGDKLVLSSKTPKEWNLEQETKDQYLVKCKLA